MREQTTLFQDWQGRQRVAVISRLTSIRNAHFRVGEQEREASPSPQDVLEPRAHVLRVPTVGILEPPQGSQRRIIECGKDRILSGLCQW